MNPLFNAMQGAGMFGGSQTPAMMKTVQNIMGMMKGQNPDAVVNMMMQRNPQFAQFMRQHQGHTPEQVAAQYGLDYNQIRAMMG